MFYENVGKPVRSSGKWLFLLGAALLLTGMGYSAYLYHKASTPSVPEVKHEKQSQYAYGALIPMTDLPQAVWPNLGIQPEGKSSVIEIPKPGMRAVVLGNNLKTHVVYGNSKRECVVSEEECAPGATAFYVSNTSKEMNIVSYAFTY